MTDLSQFADISKQQDDGVDVSVVHPKTGEDLGIKIRVAGPDSARQKKARALINNERMIKSRNKRATTTELEDDAVRITAASVISWEGLEENGKPVEFSKENAEDVFRRHPWLYDQVTSSVGDRAVFIKS